MRILDRYAVRQLLPVWLWCLTVFIFVSCLIDLFGRLDEILRYHIPLKTVWQYYLNFTPLVIVRASPLALLFSAAFIATRLVRYQELLAINASGTSLLRASVPFLFVGWLISLGVFAMNDLVVPQSSAIYQKIIEEAFKGRRGQEVLENVATIDSFNRLYHARELNLKTNELHNLTVLEHDWRNRPTKTLYANQAIWTKHGWLLLQGTIYRVGAKGLLQGDPEPFVERLITYPVSPESFSQPETHPETMRYAQLRLLITRLRQTGITNVKRYSVELASKLTLPLMNLVVCLIAFVGPTRKYSRGHLQGLGISLGWGMLYYVGVAIGQGIGKEGLLFIPALVSVWAPHVVAIWLCLRFLREGYA